MTAPVADKVGFTPVAWRWRYEHANGAGTWRVRQTPVTPHPGGEYTAALVVEPLCSAAVAQELYEALESVRTQLSGSLSAQGLLEEVDAALAKARGEA